MVLVDTSVWVEFFKKSPTITIPKEMIPSIAVCPPIVQEVLQGIRDDGIQAGVQESLLSFKIAGERMELDTYIEASNIYRSGRRRGITIRSSVDCLIAAIALKEKLQIWHRDRDFAEIAKFTEIKIFRPLT